MTLIVKICHFAQTSPRLKSQFNETHKSSKGLISSEPPDHLNIWIHLRYIWTFVYTWDTFGHLDTFGYTWTLGTFYHKWLDIALGFSKGQIHYWNEIAIFFLFRLPNKLGMIQRLNWSKVWMCVCRFAFWDLLPFVICPQLSADKFCFYDE